MFATYMGNIPLIKLLIKYGADLNRQDKNGFSPLLYATKANLEFTCLYLIEKFYKLSIF
jgi:ankyrin repeat protein